MSMDVVVRGWRGGLFRLTGRVGLVVAALSIAGCAGPKSTVSTRMQERPEVFETLSPEHQQAVLGEQVKVGMSEDAVFLSWGKPAQILQQGDASGESTIWIYTGTTTDEFFSWRYYHVPGPNGSGSFARYLDRDVSFRDYVSAELVFRDGELLRWRTLPRPSGNTYYTH